MIEAETEQATMKYFTEQSYSVVRKIPTDSERIRFVLCEDCYYEKMDENGKHT